MVEDNKEGNKWNVSATIQNQNNTKQMDLFNTIYSAWNSRT